MGFTAKTKLSNSFKNVLVKRDFYRGKALSFGLQSVPRSINSVLPRQKCGKLCVRKQFNCYTKYLNCENVCIALKDIKIPYND